MLTIILAAGKTDHANKGSGLTSSRHLTLVNGRPAISWVVTDVLKKTEDNITIAISDDDIELQNFCTSRYGKNPRVRLCLVNADLTIVQSLHHALCASDLTTENASARVILGDTYLIGIPYGVKDSVYLANFQFDSRAWCVTTPAPNGRLDAYINKRAGLHAPEYLALIGRYEFSDGNLLLQAANDAVRQNNRELSDVLLAYAEQRPLFALEIPEGKWVDFGHLEGLIKARSKLIESRSFNSLHIDPLLPEITKTSPATEKLRHEVAWYENLPAKFTSLTPRILRTSENSITMEYYGYGTLAEKFLYANLSNNFWADVLSRLFALVEMFRKESSLAPALSAECLYMDKTENRLARLYKSNFWRKLLDADIIKIDDIPRTGISQLMPRIRETCKTICQRFQASIVHGDMCFNNILYDVNSGVIKLVDPRGSLGDGQPSIYGDPRYDIAKLRHSFCGNYDSIIEGDFFIERLSDFAFHMEVFQTRQEERENLFDAICKQHQYDPREIRFIEALLFLSMIPLHDDSSTKQMAFFLSAIEKFNSFYEA